MGFLNIFKRNNTTQIVETDTSTSATSLLFGKFKTTDHATTLSAFFAATELISNSIAQLPILVKRNGEIDTNHPINFIFRNTLMTKFSFIKQMIVDIILYGNAYAYIQRAKDGTPINLIYCEHGDCEPHFNKNRQQLYYRVFCVKGIVEPVDVIHLYKNSFDSIEGRSLVAFATNILNLAKATDKAASRYYSSGCSIQGALTIKGTRKNSKEQARQAFMDTHSGNNASGLVILDDDMTYTPLSSNANESQMLEARTFNVCEIARFFNISPVLLGDLSKTSYNTIEASQQEFVTHTLMPYISMFEDEFNRKLIKPSEAGVTIDFDEDYLIKADKNTTSNYIKNLTSSGVLSINEARYMLGMQPIEGGDEHIIPYTDVNANKVNSDGEEPEETQDKNTEENNDEQGN